MIFGTVIGRVTKDAGEIRYTGSGTQVIGFSVACDAGYGDKKHTNYVNCSMFGKRAEAVHPYIKKGIPVTVIGELDQREWESNGKSGISLDMRVSELQLQGSKNAGQQQAEPQQGFREPQQPIGGGGFDDDDIPF